MAGSAGVCRGDGRCVGEEVNQREIDSGLAAFDVDRVDQKLAAVLGQVGQCGGRDFEGGEPLPPIRHHPVPAVADPTRKVEHQPVSSHKSLELGDSGLIQFAVTKHPACHDDMARTGAQPRFGVGNGDAPSEL